jgi:hypothetical protein
MTEKVMSQMAPYSLYSALLLTRALGCHLGRKQCVSIRNSLNRNSQDLTEVTLDPSQTTTSMCVKAYSFPFSQYHPHIQNSNMFFPCFQRFSQSCLFSKCSWLGTYISRVGSQDKSENILESGELWSTLLTYGTHLHFSCLPWVLSKMKTCKSMVSPLSISLVSWLLENPLLPRSL